MIFQNPTDTCQIGVPCNRHVRNPRVWKHFNLTDFNGKDAGNSTLPLATTHIIDREGVIHCAFASADYRKRGEPDDIIESLNKNPL